MRADTAPSAMAAVPPRGAVAGRTDTVPPSGPVYCSARRSKPMSASGPHVGEPADAGVCQFGHGRQAQPCPVGGDRGGCDDGTWPACGVAAQLGELAQPIERWVGVGLCEHCGEAAERGGRGGSGDGLGLLVAGLAEAAEQIHQSCGDHAPAGVEDMHSTVVAGAGRVHGRDLAVEHRDVRVPTTGALDDLAACDHQGRTCVTPLLVRHLKHHRWAWTLPRTCVVGRRLCVRQERCPTRSGGTALPCEPPRRATPAG